MTISEKLREKIQTVGIYRAAKNAGTTTPMVSRFMSRKRTLTLTTADNLAESLGLRLIEKSRKNH
jgi:antitoxin component HigA of HigAB toxin-antitoxin module